MKYSITNRPFTLLLMQMEKGETLRCKPGSMAWMSTGIRMDTKLDTVPSALRKIAVGRAPLYYRFVAEEAGELALARNNPGDILTFDISKTPIIIQKLSYLASTEDTTMEVYIHEKITTGIFSGSGFLMEKYTGRGTLWIGIDGSLMIRELAEGEAMVVEPGYVTAMETSCSMDIQWVQGISNVVLGTEGLFHTVIRGPGKVWLQTMPLNSYDEVIDQTVSKVIRMIK